MLFIAAALIFTVACSQPSAISSEPEDSGSATRPTCADKALDALLKKIEDRSNQLKTFQADMHYEHLQLFIDDIRWQTGSVVYVADPQRVRFRIHFDKVKQWDITETMPEKFNAHDEDFAFDGSWLTHRNGRLKSLKRWQVSEKPQKKEAFRLGHSAFPLPFAITRKDLTDNFEITRLPADPNDPAETEHLQLMPKDSSPFKEDYHRFDLWVSRAQALPVQFRYETPEAEIVTSRWSKITIDQPVNDKAFQLDETTGKDWTIETIPFKKQTPPN